jgi:predicted SAM-dependent methyltransferase
MIHWIKKQIKKVVRKMMHWPVIGPFIQIAVFVIRLPKLQTQHGLFATQQLPALLQTLSDLNHHQVNLIKSTPVALRTITRHLNTLQNQLNHLCNHVELIRQELKHEIRCSVPAEKQSHIEPKIISLEKLEQARKSKLKLNLGCGHLSSEEYINVDQSALPGVDVVAQADNLPFNPEEIDEIYCYHLLERFPIEQLKGKLLPYYFKLLKANGRFKAIVPDAKTMIHEFVQNRYLFEDLREVIYGTQDYDTNFHFNMFTQDMLHTLLLDIGFIEVEILDQGRRNGKCYEFEITAIKPAPINASNRLHCHQHDQSRE